MNLLFLTHANLTSRVYGDGSTRYRCFNIAEVAQRHGHTAEVVELDKLRIGELSKFDLISWLRPTPGRKATAIINRTAALGIPCIADVDDLIFDPNLAFEAPSVTNGFVSAEKIEKRFAGNANLLKHFNAITVSTSSLLAHVQRCFASIPSAVVHNGLSEYWLQHADLLTTNNPGAVSAAYLPGTRSHDQDFQSICNPLAKWLRARPDCMLDIAGKLEYPQHQLPKVQVRHIPWMDYYRLPSAIKGQCATLAPLTTSRFNESKSHVKFIESAALGVPLIGSSIPDLTQHQCPGLVFADTDTQWFEALQQISDPEYLKNVTTQLSQYARLNCGARHYAGPLIHAWESSALLPISPKEAVFSKAA